FNHTKADAVFEAGGNQYANIFYRGKDASELLPSGGTAQYNGAWTVVRKVEVNPGEAVVGYGPDSLNTRTPADFTVDFSNKSIRGNLNKNLANDQAFAYTLNGKINGN
ncbi:transferrin-binding protein-like solute binding protein, partial [Klebsiella michiganensis]|uniref:transferrin-binding protein-like solute binding protein n=1 Tax=Klebsiella michiganensis TaxID=1134687 RepID=UPI0012B82D08